jgi:Tfp pilus assembly protein PilF
MKTLTKVLALAVAVPLAAPLAGCSTMPKSLSLDRTAENKTHMNVARIHEKQGRLGQAREMYETLLKKDRKNAEAHQRLAVIAARQGEPKVASEHFRKAIEIDPRNVELKVDFAYMLYTQEEYAEAETLLHDTLRSQPDHKRALNNMALVAGRQGRNDEALTYFKRSVGEARAYANVAYLCAQAGDLEKAEHYYSKALTSDSSLKTAGHALVQIHQARQMEAAHIARKNGTKPEAATPAAEAPIARRERIGRAPAPVIAEAAAEAVPAEVAQSPIAVVPVERAAPTAPAIPLDETSTVEDIQPASAVEQTDNVPRIRNADLIESASDVDEPRSIPESSDQSSRVLRKGGPDLLQKCGPIEGDFRELCLDMMSDDPAVRKVSVNRAGRAGAAAAALLPAVRELCKDDDAYVRVHAAIASWKISGDHLTTTRHLVEGLSEAQPGVRSFSAAALGEIGPLASAHLPELRSALVDKDMTVRVYVAEACCRITPKDPVAREVLLRSLKHEDRMVRETAAYALANLKFGQPDCVAALQPVTADEEPSVRAAAVFALGEIGDTSDTTRKALREAAQDDDTEVRVAAKLALRRLDAQLAAAQ